MEILTLSRYHYYSLLFYKIELSGYVVSATRKITFVFKKVLINVNSWLEGLVNAEA